MQTFEFEGAPGNVSMDTAAMVQAGMAEGMNAGYDSLDELLAKLVANS